MMLRKASILRIDQRWIPDAWILRPQFKLWPSQRHRATIWMLAQFVAFRTQHRKERTNSKYIYHLQEALQTIYLHKHRLKLVGNYLTILTVGSTPGQNDGNTEVNRKRHFEQLTQQGTKKNHYTQILPSFCYDKPYTNTSLNLQRTMYTVISK
jgi:hypothetical protein